MPALKLKSLKLVGISLLTLFLLTMSLSVVHQGHSYSTSHSDISPSATVGSSLELNQVTLDSLVTDVCIGAIFLVLIVCRKYAHGKIFSPSGLTGKIDRLRLLNFTRPPNLVLRLSLPQLGVFRI